MATCVVRVLWRTSRRNCAFLTVATQNDFTNKRNLATKKLLTVGKLESPKQQGKYVTGQLFLHRIFGYRGILLFPWLARLYDRDVASNKHGSLPTTAESGEHIHTDNKEVKGKTHVYYQVLIDSRDCPFIRAQTEAVTFLGNQDNNRSLYAIPGLDYVAHEDILPYSTTEKNPIQHELFDKFLERSPGQDTFVPKDTLKAWQEKNHPWLELSDVHRETTENVRVTVIPFYMGARVSQDSSVYWWRYCIRLENLGEETVQLRERHWRIFSLSGTLETVRGRGVVGQEPILSKEQPAFQYSSHVSLQAPSGHMWGTFRIEKSNGQTFDCRIPPFTLESKQEDHSSPHGFFG
ncbi:polymerase delta-interacting protein 2-like isoform X1 [Acanthaster planci]|uniref:Polymerase delta-interacting protein 2-like isoform X1 n=1 Tax=Acanthaster planci TaxID=133434 RepID=A0A8B7Z685_ACAPL|nr:polymerase delta-interacting protein 2-like isoform X1 [Acanthaster planci]